MWLPSSHGSRTIYPDNSIQCPNPTTHPLSFSVFISLFNKKIMVRLTVDFSPDSGDGWQETIDNDNLRTLGQLKAYIENILVEIPSEEQKLMHGDVVLCDDDMPLDILPRDGSGELVLDLFWSAIRGELQVSVEEASGIIQGGEVQISISGDSLVWDLKDKISQMYGISIYRQSLFLNDALLCDEECLEDYLLDEYGSVKLEVKPIVPEPARQVCVIIDWGQNKGRHIFSVDPDDTILTLQLRAQRTGIVPEGSRFVVLFKGVEQRSGDTFRSANIPTGSELVLDEIDE